MSGAPTIRALARQVSRSLRDCALVHLPRQGLDVDLARRQHADYLAALQAAGVSVTVLPEEPGLPDAAFVEDPVVVLDEVAILCRLGTISREPETNSIAPGISQFRPIRKINSPGTLEGGDVLRTGKTLFVGKSSRTNQEGIRQLEQIVQPFGYRVITTGVHGCLHLKTAITSPREGLWIANPAWIDPAPFREWEIAVVPASEPWGANTLTVNGTVLAAASAPRTAELLRGKGLSVRTIDISELQKAEAGLTCLSLLFREP